MNDSFERFGGYAAILTGVLSIVYAVFFLIISRSSEYTGILGSWIILAFSGLFSSAAILALYRLLRTREDGFSQYAMLLGVLASFATLIHGGYQSIQILQTGQLGAPTGGPSQVDPAGLAAFGVTGIVALLFGWLVIRTGALPRNLGYVGLFNGILLIVLFFATVFSSQTLILISGGLTSVIVGPIWWIWLGRALMRARPAMVARPAAA